MSEIAKAQRRSELEHGHVYKPAQTRLKKQVEEDRMRFVRHSGAFWKDDGSWRSLKPICTYGGESVIPSSHRIAYSRIPFTLGRNTPRHNWVMTYCPL